MPEFWCPVCSSDHPPGARCPGDPQPVKPEVDAWRVAVETSEGVRGYGVLLADVGERWRARIITFPRTLWSVPGGRQTMKFFGRTPAAAQDRATAYIRQHCVTRGELMRDELELASVVGDSTVRLARPRIVRAEQVQREGRYARILPVLYGENVPNFRARTGNMSRSGIFVATSRPCEYGDLVGLMLELEHGKVPLRGSVIWQRPTTELGHPPGMGLSLLNPPRMYASYVDALGVDEPDDWG